MSERKVVLVSPFVSKCSCGEPARYKVIDKWGYFHYACSLCLAESDVEDEDDNDA